MYLSRNDTSLYVTKTPVYTLWSHQKRKLVALDVIAVKLQYIEQNLNFFITYIIVIP